MVDSFLEFYSAQVLSYYKFRTKRLQVAQDFSLEEDDYHIIAKSQKTLVELLLKGLVLNLDLTQRLLSKVEHHFESSKNDFIAAKDFLQERTLKDWKVEA